MLIFNEKPGEPNKFKKRAKDLKKEVEKKINKKEKPEFKKDIWKDYKDIFFEKQQSKCGYCECIISGNFGDIEHYRPKNKVTKLSDDPKTWGEETTKANNVKGRKFLPVSDIGYWWLAYSWDNYLLSCTLCNRTYKFTLFPVKGGQILPLDKNNNEVPLLLNPFNKKLKPHKHLKFNKLGFVEPKNESSYGFETIRTCGLNRQNLVTKRRHKAVLIFYKLDKIKKTTKSNEIDEYLSEIYRIGTKDKEFAGMVRIILQQETGNKWKDMKEKFKNNN